jgi:O-antigen/teichoic acid export membrane protein
MSRTKKIFINGISNATVRMINILISFFSIPITINYLGQERYGLIMTITSFLSLMALSDLGLGIGLLNEVAKSKSNNTFQIAKSAVSNTFFSLLTISVILFLFLMIYNQFSSWDILFKIVSNNAKSEINSTIIVSILIFLINMPLSIVQRIYEGKQEGYKYQLWMLAASIISFLTIYLSIHNNADLPTIAACMLGANLIINLIIFIILFLTRDNSISPNKNLVSSKEIKKIVKIGFVFFLLNVFTLLINATDNFIIIHIIGLSHVTTFEVVKKIFFLSMIAGYFITPLWPAFAEAIESRDYIWVKRTRKKAILMSMSISLIIGIFLVLFSNKIIKIWINDTIAPTLDLLFGFLIYSIIFSYVGVMSALLNSTNYAKHQLAPIIIAFVISVPLKIKLGSNFGLTGVIWGNTLSWTICYIIPSYIISNKLIARITTEASFKSENN